MPLRVLIADDEPAARHGMLRALKVSGCELLEAENGDAAWDAIRDGGLDLVFLDLTMPGRDGLSLLRGLAALPATQRPAVEIVVVTANEQIGTAVECMRLGAVDYLTKPFEVEQLRSIVRRTAERIALRERVTALQQQLDQQQAFGALVGISRPMRELFGQITRAAKTSLPILIRGETGTGKELIAREIHRLSDRAAGPFVAVNTAAIAESLTESELFGHVKGAFTGADADRTGFFRQADGGTLFLDEIGDMPSAAQSKILRAIQERIIQPVGSSKSHSVDVHIVSATHQDLEAAVSESRFRQDLFFRIRGIELRIPPLRNRREDIVVLANYFLERSGATSMLPTDSPRTLATDAIDALLAHAWPGNVRELEQAVLAAAAMCESKAIRATDLPLPRRADSPAAPTFADLHGLPLTEAKAQLVEQFERSAIEAALSANGDNISAAARQLGLHRQSLQQKMQQLGLTRATHK